MRQSDEAFLALLRPEEGKLLRIARALTGRGADADAGPLTLTVGRRRKSSSDCSA